MDKKTTIYLPEDLRRSLAFAAKREGRPQAEIVREALANYIAREPGPMFRSIGLGEDSEVYGETSKSWVKEAWQKKGK